MILLNEEELVNSITEQMERSAAVIGQTDLGRTDFDPTAIIVSSLSNIFDSALVVLALEDISNNRDECYKSANKLVISSSRINSEQKDFIRNINSFRSEISLDTDINRSFDSRKCLEFLNYYDCFMYQFFQNSNTVKRMKAEGKLDYSFVSVRNILEKLVKKQITASKPSSYTTDLNTQLTSIIELLTKIADENVKLNRRIDELNYKLNVLSSEKSKAYE